MLANLTDTLVFATEAAGEEDEGGSFLVSPDVGLMVWTLALFGVSLFILWKVAFPRIAEALDKRQHAIEDAIDTADRTRREIQEIRAEVADLTILATEKVTRKTLTAEDQRRLVEEAVAELDFATLSGEER